MSRRRVGRGACRPSFCGSGAKCREYLLGLVRVALWTANPFVTLIELLQHFKSFLTVPAFVFIDRHISGSSVFELLILHIVYVMGAKKERGVNRCGECLKE
jgi:hypothetical protein